MAQQARSCTHWGAFCSVWRQKEKESAVLTQILQGLLHQAPEKGNTRRGSKDRTGMAKKEFLGLMMEQGLGAGRNYQTWKAMVKSHLKPSWYLCSTTEIMTKALLLIAIELLECSSIKLSKSAWISIFINSKMPSLM